LAGSKRSTYMLKSTGRYIK